MEPAGNIDQFHQTRQSLLVGLCLWNSDKKTWLTANYVEELTRSQLHQVVGVTDVESGLLSSLDFRRMLVLAVECILLHDRGCCLGLAPGIFFTIV